MALAFHLRLEEGGGRLELARPLPVGPLSVEALILWVGTLTGAMELKTGAATFRHRRSHVLEACVHVPGTFLREQLQVRPDSVHPDGSDLRVGPSDVLERGLEALGHVQVARDDLGLRIVRPLHAVLVEAMVPHGWRAPDDDGIVWSVHPVGDALRLEAERAT